MNLRSLKFIAILTFSSNIILGIINWSANFVVLQKFSTIVYSNFYTFISVLSILFIPATSLNLIVNKYGLDDLKKFIKLSLHKRSYVITFLILVLINILLCLYLIKDNLILAIVVLATVFIYYFSSIGKSYMMYLHRFNYCNIASLAEVVVKLLMLIGLIYILGNSEIIPYIALYSQFIVSAIICYIFIKNNSTTNKTQLNELKLKDFIPSLLLSIIIILFINLDGLFVNNIISIYDRKIYLNYIQYSKIIYFVGLGFQPIITSFIEKYNNYHDKNNIINKFGLLMVGINLLFVIFIFYLSKYIAAFNIIQENYLYFTILSFGLTLFCINLYRLVYLVHKKQILYLSIFLILQSILLSIGFTKFNTSVGFSLTFLITSVIMFFYLNLTIVLDNIGFDAFKFVKGYTTYRAHY